MTGYTVVTRESEWDDFERDRLLALAHYEAGVHDCGWHVDLINDPDLMFTAEARTCDVCKGAAMVQRAQDERDEQDQAMLKRSYGEKVPASVPLPADGRSIVTTIKLPND